MCPVSPGERRASDSATRLPATSLGSLCSEEEGRKDTEGRGEDQETQEETEEAETAEDGGGGGQETFGA